MCLFAIQIPVVRRDTCCQDMKPAERGDIPHSPHMSFPPEPPPLVVPKLRVLRAGAREELELEGSNNAILTARSSPEIVYFHK